MCCTAAHDLDVTASLAGSAAAIASLDLSPTELTQACLRRADRAAGLGAFVTVDEQGALSRAAALTEELAQRGPRGPLHGIPVSVKDTIDVRGLPTRAGSTVLDGEPAAHDAAIVTMLRRAGAVIMGKTATHEFAYGVTTRGCRNPWNPTRLAGGSSGGAAVAVAIGASPLAIGSDTAGSVRIPAALCGTSGLKARTSSLPLEGVWPLAPSFDSLGLLAVDARDLALAWAGIHGTEHDDPLPSLRVGWARTDALGEVDGEVLDLALTACRALCQGAPATVPVPSFDAWARPRGVVIAAEALAVHRSRGLYPDRATSYGEDVAEALARARKLTDAQVTAARDALAMLRSELLAAIRGVDILATPTTPCAAPDAGHPELDPGLTAELTRLCGPVNIAGLAAVTVCCGLTRDAMPVGLQLIGRDEMTVLAAAQRFQIPSTRPSGDGLTNRGDSR